mgnify:CR=1 FL=1
MRCWCSTRPSHGSIRRWPKPPAPSAPRLIATFIIVFVFALGAYLLPQLLGRPEHWTLSVLITDQAIYQSNMPFAAAMAVFLVVTSLSLVLLTTTLGRKGRAA